LLAASTNSHGQKKAERKLIKQLKQDIEFLASDELEGRRTASEGERKAANYIEERYKKMKIEPYKGQYQHPFQFIYGKEIAGPTQIKIGSRVMDHKEEAFPLPFSANTSKKLYSEVLPDVLEEGNIWMIPLYEDEEEAKDAHFDYEKVIYDKAKDAKKQGAMGLLLYDNYNAKYPPRFNIHSEFEALDIPVAFITYNAFEAYVKNRQEGVSVEMDVEIKKSEYTGTNVAAYIDNKAPFTVVLGAHYDHLGYGDERSSLHAGKDKQIHNGADDNASGTAGLLELAARIKKDKLRNYNYLFVHFSGEELGLLGSKAFVKQMSLDSSGVAYMMNMDMVGRLNDSTHALTVGGVGTSPVWGQFITKTHKNFKISIDSSGVGPSDHTSFYYQGIPVLFFFTGLHHDYHKPSDDAHKINYPGQVQVLKYAYSIIDVMDTRIKPEFTATKQATVGKVRFKVTLGIMPDYSYQAGDGIRVDGVTEDRPAIKAGIKAGDIITQLGDQKVNGMQSYMEALSKFKSGQTVTVEVLREGKPVKMKLTF
jgi:Zn-dependent M28 family amino/carboxypeptidase